MALIQKSTSAQNTQDFIRIQDLFYLCLGRWYWFVLSLGVCFGFAVWYLLKTPPVYTRTASILIKDNSNGKSTGAMEDFADLGMFSTNTNVVNEMATLQSPDFMREVVSRLNLNTDYHVDGHFHQKTVYGDQLPVKATLVDVPENGWVTFTLQLLKDGSVSLNDFQKGEEKIDGRTTGKLNDTLSCAVGNIVVTPTSSYEEGEEMQLYVSHIPVKSAADAYLPNLSVTQKNEKSNIVSLSFNDVSTQRAEDVLNTLIAVYNENWVRDKNQIAVSTSMFINERLGVIERELGDVDNNISSYKSEHLLPDVQAAAGMYMSQASETNTAIKELKNQAYIACYIRNSLNSETSKYQLLPVVSTTFGNSNLSSQISEYNTQLMERNNLISHSSVKNPLIKEMDASINALRDALISSIDNELVALDAQIKSQKSFSKQITSQIASIPNQEKYLLSVERQQKVKESLYLYLLQKREENELSQAFTAYNTRIITMPEGSMIPTAPVKKNILLMALALGILIPIVVIFIKENMNTVIRGRKDLENITIPFVGEIPLSFRKKKGFSRQVQEEKFTPVVKERSRNVINEAFRVVRTNLEFMQNKENESHVIMITSANPGSGKTFISFNLATSLSIKNKRTIVIDLDLRKASLSRYVNSPKKGISDYLVGDVKDIKDVIARPSEAIKLEIIPVGTMPPNPTELLFSERLSQLIDELRKEYDYIFIDCPPVEIVADASIISKLVDMTLFIVRAGLLERSMLPEIERFYTEEKYKNMSLILNATDGGSGRYGYKYGYKYGYHYGYAGYAKDE